MENKFFHSEDPSLTEYNGMRVTETGRWQEACEGFSPEAWWVVQVRFADGTEFTCKPEEITDTEPEEYWCFKCNRFVAIGNLAAEHGHGRDYRVTKDA